MSLSYSTVDSVLLISMEPSAARVVENLDRIERPRKFDSITKNPWALSLRNARASAEVTIRVGKWFKTSVWILAPESLVNLRSEVRIKSESLSGSRLNQ